MLPAWQADLDLQQTVPCICRGAEFFDEVHVDKEGFAQLDMTILGHDKFGKWGQSEDTASTLTFGKPQPLSVQHGPLGGSETYVLVVV